MKKIYRVVIHYEGAVDFEVEAENTIEAEMLAEELFDDMDDRELFETDDGTVIDVVLTECKEENNRKKIDVYCYEDVYTEDFTRKYTLDSEEIYKALDI